MSKSIPEVAQPNWHTIEAIDPIKAKNKFLELAMFTIQGPAKMINDHVHSQITLSDICPPSSFYIVGGGSLQHLIN